MRKGDLKVGETYAFYEGSQAFYIYTPESYRMQNILRRTCEVEVISLNFAYNKKIAQWSDETRPAKGIRVRLTQAPHGELTLPSGTKLVMPWAEFLDRTKETRKYLERKERKAKAAVDRCMGLVKRAKDARIKVSWEGDEDDPSFTLSERELKKLLDRLEKTK